MSLITDIVQHALSDRIDPSAKLNTISIEGDGSHGLVLWQRPGEYIVHRWFTHYTNGEPVRDGVLFHSGGYYRTLAEAALDLAERAR